MLLGIPNVVILVHSFPSVSFQGHKQHQNDGPDYSAHAGSCFFEIEMKKQKKSHIICLHISENLRYNLRFDANRRKKQEKRRKNRSFVAVRNSNRRLSGMFSPCNKVPYLGFSPSTLNGDKVQQDKADTISSEGMVGSGTVRTINGQVKWFLRNRTF